jgi:hypothetical protein
MLSLAAPVLTNTYSTLVERYGKSKVNEIFVTS